MPPGYVTSRFSWIQPDSPRVPPNARPNVPGSRLQLAINQVARRRIVSRGAVVVSVVMEYLILISLLLYSLCSQSLKREI